MASKNDVIGYEEFKTNQELKDKASKLFDRITNNDAAKTLLNEFLGNKDGIRTDVFEYFCNSDFLTVFQDEANDTVKQLMLFNVDHEWYAVIEEILKANKSVSLYCKQVYICYTQKVSADETLSLYRNSKKPSDMTDKRKKNKRDTVINKEYAAQEKAALNTDTQEIKDTLLSLNGSFQALNQDYHDLRSYISFLLKENEAVRSAQFDIQLSLDEEKEKNAVLSERLSERENYIKKLEEENQQLKEKGTGSSPLQFSIEKLELILQKNEIIIDAIEKLPAAISSGTVESAITLPETSVKDALPVQDVPAEENSVEQENVVPENDLDLTPDFSEAELQAMIIESNNPTEEFSTYTLSSMDAEYGYPDEETLAMFNGTETTLFDPDVNPAEVEESVTEENGDKVTETIPEPEPENEVIAIKDYSNVTNKRARIFAGLLKIFESKNMAKKDDAAQKNMLFKKMREYGFEADRIGIIKQLLDTGAEISPLYKLIEGNPSVEVLNGMLIAAQKDMRR